MNIKLFCNNFSLMVTIKDIQFNGQEISVEIDKFTGDFVCINNNFHKVDIIGATDYFSLFIYDYYVRDSFLNFTSYSYQDEISNMEILWIKDIVNGDIFRLHWLSMSNEIKKKWLRFSYFYSLNKKQFLKNNIVIDCQHISNDLEFLCSVGEAFFGVGGYLGSDLHGFFDIISGNYYTHIDFSGIELTWLNFSDIKIDRKSLLDIQFQTENYGIINVYL